MILFFIQWLIISPHQFKHGEVLIGLWYQVPTKDKLEIVRVKIQIVV
jgi:hypothetical protein